MNMTSSNDSTHNKIIIDSVHGDIRLNETERKVVDTAPFQRLRQIKQLGMGHLTYPNATHTRFAHSLGVFHITCRILDIDRKTEQNFEESEIENLRLAALLHDIGHYPYSHLLEKVDDVQLTEDQIHSDKSSSKTKKTLKADAEKFPKHEVLGRWIVTSHPEILQAVGGEKRAKAIADIFTRDKASDLQKSKLIHSSADMDRLDYLVRDALATGAPYGKIDLNYLLNNLHISPKGMVGFSEKALPAVEHMLLARFYMHRTVYFHKTTFGFEQACAQLLRRLRDQKAVIGLPRNPQEIREYVTTEKLARFTDSLVDTIILRAAKHKDTVIANLARAVLQRKPPKLLKEVNVFHKGEESHDGTMFYRDCRYRLADLAKRRGIPLGQFLLCETPRKRLEARPFKMTAAEARYLETEEEEETTYVFRENKEEPEAIVDIKHSLLNTHEDFFQSFRLYLVYNEEDRDAVVSSIQKEIQNW